jgi:hypothetical protein
LKIELFALKEEKRDIAHLSEKHMETQSVTLSLGEQRGQRVVGRKKERKKEAFFYSGQQILVVATVLHCELFTRRREGWWDGLLLKS